MPAEYGDTLSERELEVVALVAEGLTNREVAEHLYLSPNTVKVHLRNIFAKTGVASRIELSMMAVKEGWVVVEDVAPETPPALEEEDADVGTIEDVAPLTNRSMAEETATVETIAVEVDHESTQRKRGTDVWPWHRTIAMAMGLILALVILFLRPRASGSAISSEGGPFDYNPTDGWFVSATTDDPSVGSSIGVAGSDTTEEGWQELTPMPVRRAGLGVTLLDGNIYVMGGDTSEGPTGRVDIYNIKGQSWSTGTARPLAAANIAVVPLKGDILVPGGCKQQIPSDTVHRYSPDEDTWEEVAPLPQPLCAYAMAALNGKAYLFGGWGASRSDTRTNRGPGQITSQASNYQALTYRYDPETNTWEILTPPKIARAFGAAAALDNRLYYIGGYDGKEELATCEVYDPAEDQWGTCARLLIPRGGLGLATQGWRLYVVGGGWDNYLGFNEYYNPKTDAPEGTWSLVETPLVGEWRNLGLVATETTLYALGGWHGDYLNRTYALETYSFRIFLPAIP